MDFHEFLTCLTQADMLVAEKPIVFNQYSQQIEQIYKRQAQS